MALDLSFLLDDEPTSPERAQAMAAALRRQRDIGTLALLTGDKSLGAFGAAQLQGAGEQEQLATRGQERRLSRALAAQQAAESERAHRAGEAARQDELGLQQQRLRLEQQRANAERFQTITTDQGIFAFDPGSRKLVPLTAPNGSQLRPPAKPVSDVAELRRDMAADKQVEALSKRLENVPSMKNDLATLIEFASAKDQDIPGVGATGRVPTFLLSEEGKRVRQASRGLVGALIKEQSGTAASESEVARKLEELGMGPNASDAEIRQGVARLTTNLRATMQGKEAGYDPEVVRTARQRGLPTHEDLPTYSADGEARGSPSSGPHGPTVRQNGVTYTWNPQTGRYE